MAVPFLDIAKTFIKSKRLFLCKKSLGGTEKEGVNKSQFIYFLILSLKPHPSIL